MTNRAGSSETPDRLGAFPFVIGGISFIPLIGIPFGIIAVVWGLLSKKTGAKKLILTGALGIAFTFLVYGGLGYLGFVQHGGMFDELRRQVAQTNLNQLVPAVEFYKLQHGVYPESLQDLDNSLPKNSKVGIYDSTFENRKAPRDFFYQRADDDHYYLLGVGPDGQPFTSDDLLPNVDTSSGKLGLLIKSPAEKQP